MKKLNAIIRLMSHKEFVLITKDETNLDVFSNLNANTIKNTLATLLKKIMYKNANTGH